MTNNYQILHGDQPGRGGKFYRVDHALSLTDFCVTQMLTRDLLAVANLVADNIIRYINRTPTAGFDNRSRIAEVRTTYRKRSHGAGRGFYYARFTVCDLANGAVNDDHQCGRPADISLPIFRNNASRRAVSLRPQLTAELVVLICHTFCVLRRLRSCTEKKTNRRKRQTDATVLFTAS